MLLTRVATAVRRLEELCSPEQWGSETKREVYIQTLWGRERSKEQRKVRGRSNDTSRYVVTYLSFTNRKHLISKLITEVW